jgi:hypothetical protein
MREISDSFPGLHGCMQATVSGTPPDGRQFRATYHRAAWPKGRAALLSTLGFRRPAYPVSLTARVKFPFITALEAFGDLFR